MKKHIYRQLSFFCLLVLLAACVPYSFSPPTQIHINPGDHVTEPAISVDAAGRSHIAGVVDGRVVYARTTFGDLKTKLTMTMTGSGPLWTQYNPDVAATDVGTAWLVWLEQRGESNKIACYQPILLVPPPGGNSTSCIRLVSDYYSTANVMVVARGHKAFAIYTVKESSGRVGSIWYKELTHLSNTGKVFEYSDPQSGYIHSWDAGIDSLGYLHVAFLDDDNHGYKRLIYRSNVDTEGDGTMKQDWLIGPDDNFEESTPIDMDFYMSGSVEVMAIAETYEIIGVDQIRIHRCAADGCSTHFSNAVILPAAWSTQSVITDVELVGIEDSLYIGFIGESSATVDEQVFYKSSAFTGDAPFMLTTDRPTYKRGLDAVKVSPRPESPSPISFAAFSWGERDSDSMEYYSFDGVKPTNIFSTNCLSSQVDGESASNGIYHAGVFKACGDTWFTAQANTAYLPVISK